jgi:hypothetical protein
MKLYNKTRIPDTVLAPVLIDAGRAVGARTAGVIVKVTQGQSYWSCSGTASRCDWVKRWFLATRAYKKDPTSRTKLLIKGIVDTDCGMINLTMPRVRDNPHDPLERAESIYNMAAHEWGHIKQYQERRLITAMHDATLRRRRHDNRPWEKDAIKAASKAQRKATGKKADHILALALVLEELGETQRQG